MKSLTSNKGKCNFVKMRKFFLAQNAKIWGFLKTNFEISTFETGYRQNFVKIKKLILFGTKSLNFGFWAQKV